MENNNITFTLQGKKVCLTTDETKTLFNSIVSAGLYKNDSLYDFLKLLEYSVYPEQDYLPLDADDLISGKELAIKAGIEFN